MKIIGIWDEMYDQQCEDCKYDGDGFEHIPGSEEIIIGNDNIAFYSNVTIKADYRCPKCSAVHTYSKRYISMDEYNWKLKEERK